MAIVLSEKVDFITRNNTEDKEKDHLTKKEIIILNMYSSNNKTPGYMKQKLKKERTNL